MRLKKELQEAVVPLHETIVEELRSVGYPEDSMVSRKDASHHVIDVAEEFLMRNVSGVVQRGAFVRDIYDFFIVYGNGESYQVDLSPYLFNFDEPEAYIPQYIRIDHIPDYLLDKILEETE